MIIKLLVCEGSCNPPGLVATFDRLTELRLTQQRDNAGLKARVDMIEMAPRLVHTAHVSAGYEHYRCLTCGPERIF